jgi:hypothetical protein
MITLTEKQGNKKQSKLKKKIRKKSPTHTLNKTLKDIEQNIKRMQENKKQLLNSKTSSTTEPEIKIKEIANK